jgi:hypothetical protein
MRFYTRKQKEEEKKETNVYDAFVSHLDSIYFPGASEVLETKLVAFEYERYIHTYDV